MAPSVAPFIITSEDAVYIDKRIDISKCNIDIRRYSRYYWFDWVAKGSLNIIDRSIVRFAVVDGSKNGRVYAVAAPPFDVIKVQFIAIGTYELSSGDTKATCAHSKN
jgi:hypothetical protein